MINNRAEIVLTDENELESNPTAVDGEEFPVDGRQGYGIYVVAEKASNLAEDLLNTDTSAALSVGEELDEVGVGQRVVSDVVARSVGEVEEEGCDRGGAVCSFGCLCYPEAIKGDGHAGAGGVSGGESIKRSECLQDDTHAGCRDHEHDAAREAGDDHGGGDGNNERPACMSLVILINR